MATMTREEFVQYARECLSSEALEPLYDTIAEHNSECAAFGDSWPGALVRIWSSIRQVKRMEAALARIEGREPRDFHFHVRGPR